jgi:hypothetical protein
MLSGTCCACPKFAGHPTELGASPEPKAHTP